MKSKLIILSVIVTIVLSYTLGVGTQKLIHTCPSPEIIKSPVKVTIKNHYDLWFAMENIDGPAIVVFETSGNYPAWNNQMDLDEVRKWFPRVIEIDSTQFKINP